MRRPVAPVAMMVLFGLAASSGVTFAAAKPSPHEKWAAEFKKWETETYQAAKQEGKAVWYSVDPKATEESLIEAFRKKYPGISLERQAGRGSELGAKIRTEQDAGRIVADFYPVASSVTRTLAAEGRIEHFIPPLATEPGVRWYVDPLVDQKEFSGKPFPFVLGHSPIGIMINTQLVPPDKEPKSWKDLLDPQWKGKIIFHDPRVGGYGNRTWFSMKAIHGEEFWKRLVAQDLVVDRQYNLMAMGVARGEYSIGVGVSPREVAPVESAPVKFYTAAEGTPLTVATAILVKGGPHPNAAKLFLNFLLSKEAQDILGKSGARTPNRAGSQLRSPLQNLEGQKLLITSVAEEIKGLSQVQQDAKKYLGK
ncbi:MAG: extracellular solute-binding protein [Deltaproteobacteria bacterium]|nr:extracellular solute-binding protein [Deltaproteobacteria bacterium]